MPKQSQLPENTSPATTDFLSGYQASIPVAQRFKLSNLIALFWTLANIPTGGTNPITRDSESQFPFVASGGFWTGDSYAVNRNASMTAAIIYVNGRRISIAAVTARTFTASKDTYIDLLDNLDGTGTLVYTEVANNAASPSLAANSIRIGIIVTGATTIAAATSINQGSTEATLPIASSVAYAVTDSLGNLICNRTPTPGLIGSRKVASGGAGGTTSYTGVCSMPIIVPTGRKVKLTGMVTLGQFGSSQNNYVDINVIIDGGSAAAVGQSWINGAVAASNSNRPFAQEVSSPSAGLHTYTLSFAQGGGFQMAAWTSARVFAELV